MYPSKLEGFWTLKLWQTCGCPGCCRIQTQPSDVVLLQHTLWQIRCQFSGVLFEQPLPLLFNNGPAPVFPFSLRSNVLHFALPLGLSHGALFINEPLDFAVVLCATLIAFHGIHLLQSVVLCKLVHHHSTEILLLLPFALNLGCLDLLLVLIGFDHGHSVPQAFLDPCLLCFPVLFLLQLLVVLNENVFHLLLLTPLLSDCLRLRLQQQFLLPHLLPRLRRLILFAPVLLRHERQDLAILFLLACLILSLNTLSVTQIFSNVLPCLPLLVHALDLFVLIFFLNFPDNLVHHVLFPKKFLVSSNLCHIPFLHLLLQHISTDLPILLPFGLPVIILLLGLHTDLLHLLRQGLLHLFVLKILFLFLHQLHFALLVHLCSS
mmetsp:Transcript_76726/g.128953  ORF Transcript_76726/g.128953 Transcript_76726/m.128953 type:complete len:377 (+) Transcript_76726:287-1417(+)